LHSTNHPQPNEHKDDGESTAIIDMKVVAVPLYANVLVALAKKIASSVFVPKKNKLWNLTFKFAISIIKLKALLSICRYISEAIKYGVHGCRPNATSHVVGDFSAHHKEPMWSSTQIKLKEFPIRLS
jgi:hypothetical protein